MIENFWQKIPSLIDPVAFKLGFFPIRWYSVSYLVAFFVAYRLFKKRSIQKRKEFEKTFNKRKRSEVFEELFIFFFLGMFLGGRIFYALVYNLKDFLADPLSLIWPVQDGQWIGFFGFSFHGALIGVIISSWLWTKKSKLRFRSVANFVIPIIPMAYFWGRLGNFMAGELYGRQTDNFFGMKFPNDPQQLLRHPSQLYEAFGEGLILFLFFKFLDKKYLYKEYFLEIFLISYGIVRFFLEFFRNPDPQIGLLFDSLTMGQILCLIMIIAGTISIKLTKPLNPKKK